MGFPRIKSGVNPSYVPAFGRQVVGSSLPTLSQLSRNRLLHLDVALRVQRLPEPCIAAHGVDVEFGAPTEQCVGQRRVGADLGDVAAATSMTEPPVQIHVHFHPPKKINLKPLFIRSTTTNDAGFSPSGNIISVHITHVQ
jgi:hypothetical protein